MQCAYGAPVIRAQTQSLLLFELESIRAQRVQHAWNAILDAPLRSQPLPVLAVELEEGVRMLCNLLNVKAADVTVGMKVKLCWETLPDGTPYPAFEPA